MAMCRGKGETEESLPLRKGPSNHKSPGYVVNNQIRVTEENTGEKRIESRPQR